MVSKKLIQLYDFSNITEYFDYIIESKINGQRKQTIDLFNKLSSNQKLDFYSHLKEQNIELVGFLDYVKNL